jgi:hypothetical protein
MMQIKVSATKEGTLLLSSPLGGGARQYAEVEPMVFREIDGQNTIVFKEEEGGRISLAFASDVPHMAIVKLKWFENPMFHYLLLGLSLILFVTAALGWPLGSLSRKICKRKLEGNPAPKAAKWLAGLMSGFFILFVLGVIAGFSDMNEAIFGPPMLFKVSLAFPIIAGLLGIGVLIFTIQAWRKKYWTACKRVHYTLVLIAGILFLWALNFWNLVGWKL